MKPIIRALEAGDFSAFFVYLNAQLKENGKNDLPLFQPVSRTVSGFPVEKEASFVSGLSKSIGQPGWRRAWVVVNNAGDIMGHVDLRAHMEPNTSHRALLGMGVGRQWRQQGLGRALVEHSCDWVDQSRVLNWIDIEVLCANKPAIQLYQTTGFETLCEIPEMFMIDEQLEGIIKMTRKIN